MGHKTLLTICLLVSGAFLNACGNVVAQTNKQQPSIADPRMIYVFSAKELKFKTDLVSQKGSRQLEVTIDFSQVSKLYVLQRVSVLVEFFQAGKSLGTANFDLDTEKMPAVKERKMIKHTFQLAPKYQVPGLTIKGLQITAPASSDYRYVYEMGHQLDGVA